MEVGLVDTNIWVDASRALRLARRYNLGGKARVFDAFLAATAIDNKVETFYTQNGGDFRKFRAIKTINPL